ncbi:MAG: serine/threonine protein kinase [Planctomycetales bacterium]|nr:serine/threonine protein kinase [Planctomycetales bacterium]
MNQPQTCPNSETWRRWIHGSDEVDGEIAIGDDRLLSHLDSCERCQHAVAQMSADDLFYCQSRDALRSTGLTSHDWRKECGDAVEPARPETSNPAVVSLVRSLLGPSDDERSLGRLGHFEILGVVGSGGMGIVLKARSIAMDRIVAIKIPQPQYWQSPETLRTLEREARSAAAVVHPNVISIYHVDRYRDVPYLVMPYLPGQSLEHRIRQSGQMSIDESLRITRQVAAALAAAHACGVVHRDVKPANILLGAGTERVVLSDFGLAKIQSDATCTATGTFAGTPLYLSPEQASGCGAGPAGDIYSLGTVLWTMLCGQPPMAGMHAHAIVRRIADSKLPPLSEQRSDLPDWMLRLIARLHADAPADRPGADELAGWIEACQRHMVDGQAVVLPEALRTEQIKPKRSLRWVASLAAFTLLLFVGWLFRGAIDPDSDASSVASETNVDNDTEPSTPKPVTQADQIAAPVVDQSVAVKRADETDIYLDQIQNELIEVNQSTLPDWESRIQQLLR